MDFDLNLGAYKGFRNKVPSSFFIKTFKASGKVEGASQNLEVTSSKKLCQEPVLAVALMIDTPKLGFDSTLRFPWEALCTFWYCKLSGL